MVWIGVVEFLIGFVDGIEFDDVEEIGGVCFNEVIVDRGIGIGGGRVEVVEFVSRRDDVEGFVVGMVVNGIKFYFFLGLLLLLYV